jgi:hypothetical protein
MPLPNELMDEVRDSKVFTKLDLKNGYHLFHIKKGDEWKMAFNTHRGHYEMTVVPFGLTNTPAFFQTRMNEILWDLRERGVVVYIDDILIHSKDAKEHKALVKEVLMRLRKNFLYCNTKKCAFKQDDIEFLGMILSKDGVSTEKGKIDAVMSWEQPRTVKEVQSFLGFCNFYRRFIPKYSKIARPLTQLTKKDLKFEWNSETEKVFQMLKEKMCQAPVLIHANPTKPFVLETDCSDFALAGVLSQAIYDDATK